MAVSAGEETPDGRYLKMHGDKMFTVQTGLSEGVH